MNNERDKMHDYKKRVRACIKGMFTKMEEISAALGCGRQAFRGLTPEAVEHAFCLEFGKFLNAISRSSAQFPNGAPYHDVLTEEELQYIENRLAHGTLVLVRDDRTRMLGAWVKPRDGGPDFALMPGGIV